MSLRQLRTRIEHLEHLEAKSPEPVNNKKRSAFADWEERLEEHVKQWKQTKGLNEVERPLTEEEKAERDELTYRFHPLGASIKAWREVAPEQRDRDSSRRRRPRPDET
jgi:ferric-dicitrate binding protein FerR (iron transport regulator)